MSDVPDQASQGSLERDPATPTVEALTRHRPAIAERYDAVSSVGEAQDAAKWSPSPDDHDYRKLPPPSPAVAEAMRGATKVEDVQIPEVDDFALTSDGLRDDLARIIKAVTDLWDDPLDEVHDIPQIVNAILAAGWVKP